MIQLLIDRRAVSVTTMIFVCVLTISPLLSDTYADTSPAKVKTYVASNEFISSDEIKFDGKGKLDAINPTGKIPDETTGNTLASALVIIDGSQMQFSNEVKLYDELSQPLNADELHSGVYVGFNKDPSDMIRELWLVKPEAAISNIQTPQNSPEKETLPSNGTSVININGVWKN